MKKIQVPAHRVKQVISYLFNNWDSRRLKGIVSEREGYNGCYAIFSVNGIIYADSELYGQLNNVDDKEAFALISQPA